MSSSKEIIFYKACKLISLVAFIFLNLTYTVLAAQNKCEKCITSINSTLNQLHQAASNANAKEYFSLFSKNAVFIGTDPKETWSIKDFKDYAKPFFDKGIGWTYISKSRHVYLDNSHQTAWFDEMLGNKKYGETRGTGVLVKTNKGWKIAQYHLTLPIPNSITSAVVKLIQNSEKK